MADPAKPGSRVAATVTLKGGLLATPDALLKLTGPAIVYTPAVTTRRTVWLSHGFQLGHPAVTAIVRSLAGRRWRVIETDVAFRAAYRARGPRSVIGLVAEDEQRAFLAQLRCSQHAPAHDISNMQGTCNKHAIRLRTPTFRVADQPLLTSAPSFLALSLCSSRTSSARFGGATDTSSLGRRSCATCRRST